MPSNQPEQLRSLLQSVRTIALVGASNKPQRPSHEVMAYLQQQGYRVLPVNPRLAGEPLLGETVAADLASLPCRPDLVDVFLAPERTDTVIDEAIELGIPALWLQIGVIKEKIGFRISFFQNDRSFVCRRTVVRLAELIRAEL